MTVAELTDLLRQMPKTAQVVTVHRGRISLVLEARLLTAKVADDESISGFPDAPQVVEII